MADRVRFVTILVVLVGVGALVGVAAAGAGSADDATDDQLVDDCAAEPPEDFADPEDGNETIGWFDGYWYDEPIDIDASDGLTQDEVEELSARTAARFEAMRCLTFDELPSIEIMTREEFAERNAEQFAEVDDEARTYDNVKLSTMLLVGDDEDATDVRQANRETSVGGFYDFVEEHIAVISENPDNLLLDEAILAHELGHALQDQHFDLEQYDRNITDVNNAKLGIIEGDVHRVEHEYLQRCENDEWSEPCVTEDVDEEAAVDEPENWGLYFKMFQPYSDGPAFTDHVHEQGGWDAVDDVYDEMPRSALEIIYPEKYGDSPAEELDVDDRSSDDWERLPIEDDREYDVIGQAGITAMFVDPLYADAPALLVDPNQFLNTVNGNEIDEQNPLNYDLPETNGWRGDQLFAYQSDDGDTASVWKTAWEDADEAERFAETYEELVEYRGGEQVDEYDSTYEFGAESEFDGAVTVEIRDDRVWIVSGPSVDALTDIDDSVELERDQADDDQTGDDDGNDAIPGFGVTVALVAALAGAVAMSRR